ncbi:MAG: hypothetical protein LQ343_006474 [Gyalolechia ehrenbergii]|nr:MAG: hypothetical protein LQ343_006474 [Gyalolechia ehrenbergii]
MSYPPPAGGQPPSFKTNVNRAKTKRWVEAKSYTYDGDDWGDMDEYDEYAGYDEPPPPPRPTGLRQQGQSASREQQPLYQPQQGNYRNPEASQHGYGNMGRQGPVQHQYGARSVTGPPPDAQLARSGSFDHGDERRAFSATFPHQGVPPSQSDMHQSDSYAQVPSSAAYNHPSAVPALRSQPNQQGPPPALSSDYPRQQNTGGRTQSMTSTSSLDFHDRRDFSPSAVPPPLHTRGSPSPQNKPATQPAWRPPRKSSLGQQNQPEHLYEDHDFGIPAGADTQKRESTSRERTPSDSGKPLPFVRPADIYKRMQEEKERERQSQESSRPSMDAIMDDSRTGSDLRSNSSGASERGQDVEPRQKSRSTLDPVAERRSEYGMVGLSRNEAESRGGFGHQESAASEGQKSVEPRKGNDSLSPQLPDVARMSGFGELFPGTGDSAKEPSPLSSANRSDSSQTDPHRPLQDHSDSPLQHQPSLGFRSVVHQAFDTTQEQIPETPSSSNANSSIDRSGSRGTSVVSPIISRGSSSATPNLNFRDFQIRPATPPAVIEEPDREDRPQSSGSLGTPKAVLRKASPDPSTRPPASFMPGHRRDLSTPSPDNSPARTPALEANKQLHQPQEAELAMTTPIETHFPHDHGQPESSHSSQSSPFKSQEDARFSVTNANRGGLMENDLVNPQPSLAGETSKSPAESTKSRVRNLADKFESGRSSPAGSERTSSPVKTSFLLSQMTSQARPLPADRLESFRPKLPGGWESSASLAPLTVASRPASSASAIPLGERLQNTATDSGGPAADTHRYTGDRSDAFRQEEPNHTQRAVEAPASDPFASLAAAGSALAGAFSTAMGPDPAEKEQHAPRELETQNDSPSGSTTAEEDTGTARLRNTSINTALIPDASKPAMLTTPDDETSSIMPTPLDKVSQPAHSGQSTTGDYFATSTIPKQGDSYTSKDSASTERSQLLPTLSTDSGPQYESDRLRREIIRELSPRLNSESSTAGYDPRFPKNSIQSANPSLDPEKRQSLVIPREYESYWNDSGSERSSRAPSTKDPSKAVRDTTSQTGASAITPNGEPRPLQDNLSGRPMIPPHRFSWEHPSEASPLKQEPVHPKSLLNDSETGHGVINDSQGQLPFDSGARVEQQALHAPTSGLYSGDSNIPLDHLAAENTMNTQLHDPSSEKEAMLDPSKTEPGPASEHTTHNDREGSAPIEPSSSISEREPNLTGGPSGYQTTEERYKTTSQPVDNSDNLPLLPGRPTTQPKVQSFREILALKEPQDRIRAYNETREQYANIETGLAHWLAVTTAELPDHKEVLSNGRFPGTATYKPSAARAKLGSLLPGSSSTQQSYHQQHLNASSPGGAAADAGNVTGGNSPQAYSPSSSAGKLSSQQMQARGKDLLHSAGVFGGKANVAAKGLFSKGRSKFRGGSADKAPISTFNTDHQSGQQQEHQSPGHSPGTPKEESPPETSIAPEQAVSSRPTSFTAPLTQQTEDALRNIMPSQSQPPSQPWEQPPTSHVHDSRLSSDSNTTDATKQPLGAGGITQREAAQSTLAAGSPTSIDTSRNRSLASGRTQQDQRHGNQTRDVQSLHSLTSSNQTPTQADYADYFQGGLSPIAVIPQTRTPENHQPAVEGEIGQKPSLEPQHTDHGSPPTLKSKYSIQAPREVPSMDTNRTNTQPNSSQADQTLLQRGPEDSDGTFQTAESDPLTYPAKTAIESHKNISGRDHDGSAEELVRESSGEISPLSATPMAVPAANIQDQSRSRPISFVQFSKSPTLKPLEDYSTLEPNIYSAANRIDLDNDFPPSPMSSPQSVPHPRLEELGRRSLVQYGADHDLTARSGQPSSGPGSQTVSQPFQGSNLEDQPAFQREQSHYERDEMHIPEQPASIPRQHAVNPRQQSTEYCLEGVGPPPEPRPTNSTSTSKRGSRSSAFFRSLKTNPVDTTSPQLPVGSIAHNGIDSQEQSKIRKSKSRRGSLFRSLTGAAKNSSSEGNVGEAKNAAPSTNVHEGTHAVADMGERRDRSAKVPSKYRNRISRAATAKMEEQQQQEPSKKNRFSGIGVSGPIPSRLLLMKVTEPAQSLFGRSKDRKSSNTGLDRSQQGPDQGRGSKVTSSSKMDHGSTVPSGKASRSDDPKQYTRNKLAKEGFLAQDSTLGSPKTSEPSVYDRNSAQERQQFPPRNQSLGHGTQGNEQRPSDGSREPSSASSNVRTQQKTAPTQQHRVQSSVTTRSTTRHSGLRQSESNPLKFSSTTTATTTTSRMPNTNVRQQLTGNNFPRSDSPPPPPPPPKDSWHQTRPHQRSMSNNSFAQAASISNDYPSQTSNNNNSNTGPPQTTGPGNYVNPPPPNQTRQSLPPLETNIPSPSLPPAKPQGPSSPFSDLEAHGPRRSRVESMGTPKAEQPNAAVSTPAARRSEVEGEDEPIVMSATSFPGQEWQPSSFARWEGD